MPPRTMDSVLRSCTSHRRLRRHLPTRACASPPTAKCSCSLAQPTSAVEPERALGQIAAEELGIPLNEITVVIADTELTPFDHGTYSSRVTPYVGAAVKLAATDARRQLLKAAAGLWNLSPETLRLADKKVTAKGRRSMTFAEVIERSHITEIVGLGSIESKRLWAGDASGDGKGFTAPGWPFGAQAVEVEVDRETGVVKLIRVASAHDVGQSDQSHGAHQPDPGWNHDGLRLRSLGRTAFRRRNDH